MMLLAYKVPLRTDCPWSAGGSHGGAAGLRGEKDATRTQKTYLGRMMVKRGRMHRLTVVPLLSLLVPPAPSLC